jgi:UDP-glucose 4-epimerase
MKSPSATPGHVLVTGGAGFIGSHLVERLLADGERVVVIDDVSTGNWRNLRAVRDDRALRCIESRVSACEELNTLAHHAKAVVHLAAAVGVELVVNSPIRTIETNLAETSAVLEAASRHGTLVLLASTSEVYGKSRRARFSEEDDLLIGPPHLGRWSYACSKLMDEFLALAHHRERGLPVIIARLFNTVGPRQTGRYGMVLPRFIAAARAGRPLRVHGDGSQTRCFCIVHDTVEALVRLLRCPAAVGQVVNVGSTEEVSILELARCVRRELGSRSRIVRIPYASAYAPGFEDMQRRRPDVGKLARLTGLHPCRTPAEVVRLTADLDSIKAKKRAPFRAP